VSENTFADSFLLNGINFFLQGLLFIVPAYFIAPKYKIQTLKIFLILWILVVVFSEYYLHSTIIGNVGIWNSILRIIGASLAYLNITLEHKDETIHLKHEKITNESLKEIENINPKTPISRIEVLKILAFKRVLDKKKDKEKNNNSK
jgi:hypothetical protein